MTVQSCDCLNWCGDDPWLKDGRAEPCEYERALQQKLEISSKRDEARLVLHKFYNTTTIEDLVDAQMHHIERLQAKLAALEKPMRPHQKVRLA